MNTMTYPNAAPAENTPEIATRYFRRPEGTLAYTDYGGSGDYVIMLPGMGALRSEYRFLAPKLRDAGFHPVSVDLRGQGESSVPWARYDVPAVGGDILALIEHLGAKSAHVMGTSYSPAPAIWAAVEQPERVKSLVLISAFASDNKPNLFMQAAMWFMLNNPWRAQTWRMFYRTMYPTRKPADFEAYLDALVANLKEPGRFHAVKALPTAPRAAWTDRMARVTMPTLVIMGTKDADFPDPAGEGAYLAAQTRGKLVLIDGAGHYPQTEMPDETAQPIIDFLRQV